jgi:hypothetical protein
MRIVLALCKSVLDRCVSIPTCPRSISLARPIAAFAAWLCAAGLAGCAPDHVNPGYAGSEAAARASSRPPIPLPGKALLAAQPEPNCDSRTAELKEGTQIASLGTSQWPVGSVRSDSVTPLLRATTEPRPLLAEANPNADLVLLTRLALEAQCYRQAEIVARKRLKDLQAAVGETIKAVNRTEASAR